MNSFYNFRSLFKIHTPRCKTHYLCPMMNNLHLTTAFINVDKSIAIIVLNANVQDETFNIWIQGKALETKILGEFYYDDVCKVAIALHRIVYQGY